MSDFDLGLDQRLPAGYTPRELIESVEREHRLPAYLLPMEALAEWQVVEELP